MKKQLLGMLAFVTMAFAGYEATAQHRYLDEVYTTTLKQANIEYDSNRSVNLARLVDPNAPPIITAKLMCDIYTPPAGDTATARPVIILVHTGSYLPPIVNRQPTGSKDDSTIVEMCTRFAKRGFVAVAMNNRIGWNASSTNQAAATEDLLKATYRGIQDLKNMIRFLRVNASTYKIDTSKIIAGGQGTGGYIVLAAATIDRRAELETNPKFLRADFTPMVNMDTLGDWRGLGGVQFPVYPFYLNYSGDSTVSTSFHMAFHYGGAMGDSAWLETGNMPIIGLQTKMDPFAPYTTGNVIVPTTGVTVISNASGAGSVVPKANEKGANAKVNSRVYTDVVTVRGLAITGNVPNLYPFESAAVESAPWEWWDRDIVKSINVPAAGAGYLADSLGYLTNPGMSAAKAKAYIDTIQWFVVPRIVVGLDLPGAETFMPTGVKEVANVSAYLGVYPNPASNFVNVSIDGAHGNFASYQLIDITGRVVSENVLHSNNENVSVAGMKPGIYLMHITMKEGSIATKRIMIN